MTRVNGRKRMERNKKSEAEGGHKSETTSFRRLVEDQISVDEYVKRLDQRVLDRQKNEETSRGSRTGAKPQPR